MKYLKKKKILYVFEKALYIYNKVRNCVYILIFYRFFKNDKRDIKTLTECEFMTLKICVYRTDLN